jgi:hypothetical protein
LIAHLNDCLFLDIHYGNLVCDTVRGNLLATRLVCCLFSFGLLHLGLELLGLFHCVWGFIFSGFLPEALAVASVQLRKSYLSSSSWCKFLFNTRGNWNRSVTQHFSYSFCHLAPVLPRFCKFKFPIREKRLLFQCFETTLYIHIYT